MRDGLDTVRLLNGRPPLTSVHKTSVNEQSQAPHTYLDRLGRGVVPVVVRPVVHVPVPPRLDLLVVVMEGVR